MNEHKPTTSRNPGSANKTGWGSGYVRSRKSFAWSGVPRDAIGAMVQRLCDAGYGVVFGRTSDGGALSITVLAGEERIREWPSSTEDYDSFAAWCYENLELPDFNPDVTAAT